MLLIVLLLQFTFALKASIVKLNFYKDTYNSRPHVRQSYSISTYDNWRVLHWHDAWHSIHNPLWINNHMRLQKLVLKMLNRAEVMQELHCLSNLQSDMGTQYVNVIWYKQKLMKKSNSHDTSVMAVNKTECLSTKNDIFIIFISASSSEISVI